MKKLQTKIAFFIIAAAVLVIPAQSAIAQWGIGLSYQIREESPKHGFGIRLERDILQKLPLVDLGLRAHFAYFNENNSITRNGITFGEVTYYDYGLAGSAGISLGFLKPYVGIGIGASTIDITVEEVQQDQQSEGSGSETAFYWSGFVGIELTPIPKINPFIEYRFAPVDEADQVFNDLSEEAWNSDGRLILGVSISF